MTHLSTSLENETELKSIGRKNNFFQKKCSNFERKHEEISRSIKNLQTCNSQVKRMSKDKLLNVKANVERHQRKTQKFVQSSNALLSASFEKVDLIRAKNHISCHRLSPSLSVTLPYDPCIEIATNEEKKFLSSIQELATADDLFKKEKENFDKLQHSTMKAKGKVEKEIIQLREEFKQHSSIITALQSSSSEIEMKLLSVKEDITVTTATRTKLALEINEAENIRDDFLQKVEAGKTKLVNGEFAATLDDLYSDINSGKIIDMSILKNISGYEDIPLLLTELQQLESETSSFSESVHISGSEAVATLEASLTNLKKQTTIVSKNIEQFKELDNKRLVIAETLTRKKSGIEAVKKQIVDNKTILGGLKVTEYAAKPLDRSTKKEEIFRRLEATRNDVPGPEPFQSYQTPNQKAPNTCKTNPDAIKRVSKESGSSRPMNTSVPEYPGIKLLPNTIGGLSPALKSNPAEQNDSYMSEDSTLLSDDSGTTQDESLMNQVFSPLRNNKMDTPPFVEFSMADHMTEFSQRQAKIKASQTISQVKDVNEHPELDLSADSDQEDGETEESDNDEDEDLFAPDDEDDLDQSAWGSDD